MVVSKPRSAMFRAMADRCRTAAKTAPDQDAVEKFRELAADFDAAAAKSESKAGHGNGAA